MINIKFFPTVIALSASLLAPSVFAQSKNFEGWSVGLSVGGNYLKADAGINTVPNTFYSGNAKTSSTEFDIKADYSLSVTPKFALGFGVSLGTAHSDAVTINVAGPNRLTIQLADRANLSVSPSLVLNESTLVFVKMTALTGTAQLGANGVKSTATLHGFGYGAGVKMLLNPKTFVEVGYDVNTYTEQTHTLGGSFNLASDKLYTAVGYRF